MAMATNGDITCLNAKNGDDAVYRMIDFMQEGNAQAWTGLIVTKWVRWAGDTNTVVHTKVPASPSNLWNCANDDEVEGTIVGEKNIQINAKNIFIRELSSTPWITFKCFCKLNKELLNGCYTEQSYDEQDYKVVCKNGKTTIGDRVTATKGW